MPKQPAPSELITDEFLITRRFRTADDFSIYIQTTAAQKHLRCMERLVEYCEEEDIDVESAALLVNQQLRDKIQAEAESLNLLRKSPTGRLDI